MPLMEFIDTAGLRFQTIPENLPLQWRPEDSNAMAGPVYQSADIIQAIAVNFPKLDSYKDVRPLY